MPNGNSNQHAPKIEPNRPGATSAARRGYQNRPRNTIAWDEIDGSKIANVVQAVTKQGAAIMFGNTSDRGALSITILDGENRIREWPNSVEQFDALYAWLVGMFDGD